MASWFEDVIRVSLIGNKKVIIKMINTIYRNMKISEHIEENESIEIIRKILQNLQSKNIYKHYLLEYCDSYHSNSLNRIEESSQDKEEIESMSLNNLVWLNEIKELSNGEWVLTITDSSAFYPENSWGCIIEKNGFRLGVVDHMWIDVNKGFVYEYPTETYIIERQENAVNSKLYSFEPDSLVKGDSIPIHFGLLRYQQLVYDVEWCNYLLEDVLPKPEGESLKSILKDKEEYLGTLNEFKNKLSDLFGVKNDKNLIDVLYSLEFLV